jgi:hypothetical protein
MAIATTMSSVGTHTLHGARLTYLPCSRTYTGQSCTPAGSSALQPGPATCVLLCPKLLANWAVLEFRHGPCAYPEGATLQPSKFLLWCTRSEQSSRRCAYGQLPADTVVLRLHGAPPRRALRHITGPPCCAERRAQPCTKPAGSRAVRHATGHAYQRSTAQLANLDVQHGGSLVRRVTRSYPWHIAGASA